MIAGDVTGESFEGEGGVEAGKFLLGKRPEPPRATSAEIMLPARGETV